MSRINKRLARLIPAGFLWRLTFLNVIVVVAITALSGWAIYHTACFLAAEVGGLDTLRQQRFNRTLFNYLWILIIIAIFTGSVLHFYLIKRFIKPIRSLIRATKELKQGHYPDPVNVYKNDEIGQLALQYNELIAQLEMNEQQRNRLVTDVSHEIRTPLSNLNGYLQALKDGDITGDQALFASLYQESNRLSQMLEQLEQLKEWDYISVQSIVEKETHEIKTILHQCVAMFERTLEQKNIPILLKIESCKLDIHVVGIQQVISNLLENAIRYYEGDGSILVAGEKRGKAYYISVTGPSKPIPEKERENVFRRFYRLDASRSRMTGGSGLGLAISKEIIERHQGEIGIDTTDAGNRFWIVLPG
ncbi:ATP-binding protein [Sporosarcina sp. ACRSM]|uniref:sensor histidine kinase n=1 Tax=Sporosarcina sp. ACRSM TaxID=2918216 RepID=UPI001EF6B639|nr:ATP-binding protein [Sporosarcina sp. ACRSM]MCG7334594.1 ATP-binding protein [Sporosarcina sp. ACRSM]